MQPAISAMSLGSAVEISDLKRFNSGVVNQVSENSQAASDAMLPDTAFGRSVGEEGGGTKLPKDYLLPSDSQLKGLNNYNLIKAMPETPESDRGKNRNIQALHDSSAMASILKENKVIEQLLVGQFASMSQKEFDQFIEGFIEELVANYDDDRSKKENLICGRTEYDFCRI